MYIAYLQFGFETIKELTGSLLDSEACVVRMEKGDDEHGKHDNCLPDSMKLRVRMYCCLFEQPLKPLPTTVSASLHLSPVSTTRVDG